MSHKVTPSISFVINAVYTFTFANAFARTIFDLDKTTNVSVENVSVTVPSFITGAIALTMIVRYFFGNNIFIEEVFADPHRRSGVRMFSFLIVVIQSVILLGTSFSVRDVPTFFLFLAILFAVEFMWYVACLKIDRSSVIFSERSSTIRFFLAQLYGLVVIVVIVSATLLSNISSPFWTWLIFVLFLIDTGWDLRENIDKYMGVE